MNTIRLFLVMTLLTGVIYPLVVTQIAQTVFPVQANGSLITLNGKTVGSSLIGQVFETDRYFWSRPSAISYNPLPSGASNLSPASLHFKKTMERSKISESNLKMASASGLDPHITPEGARSQVDRIAIARGFNHDQRQRLMDKINDSIIPPDLRLMGEYRINVVHLNMALDQNLKGKGWGARY